MDALYRYNLCRLCLCRGDSLVDIYEANGKRDYMIADTIDDLLKFKAVKVPGVPWLACESCLDKLSDFRLFKLRTYECKLAFEARVASQDGGAKVGKCEQPREDPLGDYGDEGVGESNLTDTEVVSDSDDEDGVNEDVVEGTNGGNESPDGNSFDDEIELLELELLATERRSDASDDATANGISEDMDDVNEEVRKVAKKEKRKRTTIDLEKKMVIVSMFEQGMRQTDIARELGHPISTICTIVKDSSRIKVHAGLSAPMSSVMLTKRRTGAIYEMEKLLVKWIAEQIRLKSSVDLKTIQSKAKRIYERIRRKYGMPSDMFVASKGWFTGFRRRAGLQEYK